jgi:tetratricopeptide (TPR) repeat protein
MRVIHAVTPLWRIGTSAVGSLHRLKPTPCSAIARLTRRNPNPADGEALYLLGLILNFHNRRDEAYDSFYKATWNQAWAGASFHALAEIDCRRGDWSIALDHLDRALRFDTDNLRARSLRVMVLRRINQKAEAASLLAATLALDPLDGWSRYLDGQKTLGDAQARLDLAHDFARAGFYPEAIELLRTESAIAADLPDQSWGSAPLVAYTLGWLLGRVEIPKPPKPSSAALLRYPRIIASPPDSKRSPSLEAAMEANPRDARAPDYLGCLFYDRRRHAEAIRLWERSAKADPKFPTVWRNLGIGYFNIAKKPAKARAAYDSARRCAPADARLLFERDQLAKRLGEAPDRRLRLLEKHLDLIATRDDLSVELCALYNQTGQPAKAAAIIAGRHFQPWEGGEGQAMGQHVRSQLLLGREALDRRDFAAALGHFELALSSARKSRRSQAPPRQPKRHSLLARRSPRRLGRPLGGERGLDEGRHFQRRFSGHERAGLFRNDLFLGPRLGASRQKVQSPRLAQRPPGLRP